MDDIFFVDLNLSKLDDEWLEELDKGCRKRFIVGS